MLEGKHLPPSCGCILGARQRRAVGTAEFGPLEDWGEKAVLLECGS